MQCVHSFLLPFVLTVRNYTDQIEGEHSCCATKFFTDNTTWYIRNNFHVGNCSQQSCPSSIATSFVDACLLVDWFACQKKFVFHVTLVTVSNSTTSKGNRRNDVFSSSSDEHITTFICNSKHTDLVCGEQMLFEILL